MKKTHKIVFTGPESTGKTTLAKLCAEEFSTLWVEEYARSYLSRLNRPYKAKDLAIIAEGQFLSEQEAMSKVREGAPFFVDSSFLVIRIWSVFKYGYFDYAIEKLLKENLPDHYFLCDSSIPWSYDPLRENPDDRQKLQKIYHEELEILGVPFTVLSGNIPERMAKIKEVLEKTIEK